jgi:hypothetical protein
MVRYRGKGSAITGLASPGSAACNESNSCRGETTSVVEVEEEVVESTPMVELKLEAEAPTKNTGEEMTSNNMELHYSFKSSPYNKPILMKQ